MKTIFRQSLFCSVFFVCATIPLALTSARAHFHDETDYDVDSLGQSRSFVEQTTSRELVKYCQLRKSDPEKSFYFYVKDEKVGRMSTERLLDYQSVILVFCKKLPDLPKADPVGTFIELDKEERLDEGRETLQIGKTNFSYCSNPGGLGYDIYECGVSYDTVKGWRIREAWMWFREKVCKKTPEICQ